MAKRVVVVGAGTEIGKTHVSCLLLQALRRRGEQWQGIKPIESGVAPGQLARSDAARLAQAAGHERRRPRYLFVEPISPHLAARRSDITIELEEVARWVATFGDSDLVIETAGGLMSPLNEGTANLELVERITADGVVVVVADRLGALHDVNSMMTLLGARHPSLCENDAVMVALCAPHSADASTGTNAAEVLTLGIASQVVTVPRANTDSEEVRGVGKSLVAWCDKLVPGTLTGLATSVG
ncbi:MAG TPA: dethiobiotin synthase [Sorangium sp.]|nr:dethiobiotin synthase [Sorangium sp.]